MKRHLRILLSWLCIAAILLCAVPAVADEETPESKPAPAITHYNLSFDNEVHLLCHPRFPAGQIQLRNAVLEIGTDRPHL